MRILLVEDDHILGSSLKKALEKHAYGVDWLRDGQSGLLALESSHFAAAILDINLPIMSGYELCKIIREKYEDLSILMLTALGTTENVLTGFDAGADDYLVKPFEFRELMARLRALNRRRLTVPSEAVILKIADLEFNQKSKTVKRGNQKINLTARELALLEFFIKNQNRALSRSEIAEKVWDVNFDTGTNVVDVYVNYLRKKIDKDFTPKVIHTISGIGYIMQEQED